MNLKKIPAGINIPEDLYAIIEISAKSFPIKYEINKNFDVLFVDRFIPTAMFYPCNYGYINFTLCEDGDPLDILVISPYPLKPITVIRCRPIGLLNMVDESGNDEKVLAVPHKKICNDYNHIQDIDDLPILFKKKIEHFFQQYKALEEKKWTKIKKWENVKFTKEKILTCYMRANNFIKKRKIKN